MFDAANAFEREFQPYAVPLRAPAGASFEAAVIGATHHTLVGLYPEQAATLDGLATDALAHLPPGPARDAGVGFGAEVAARLLALRASDGAAEAVAAPYTPGSGPGAWLPTPPALRPALDPGWGNVAPFLLRTPAQFRPGPPPALTSRKYTADFLENPRARLGDQHPTHGGADCAGAALGEHGAPGLEWSRAPAHRRPGARAARVLALLHLAMADAFIAGWDAKYTYSQWRPVTGIPAADGDGNSQTPATPGWTPLLVTPPFPDYPAGHAICAGAAELVLARLFGLNPGIPLELTSATAPGVVVHASTVGEIARGVLDARVWGGVHWRTSCDRGLAHGTPDRSAGRSALPATGRSEGTDGGSGRAGLIRAAHPATPVRTSTSERGRSAAAPRSGASPPPSRATATGASLGKRSERRVPTPGSELSCTEPPSARR